MESSEEGMRYQESEKVWKQKIRGMKKAKASFPFCPQNLLKSDMSFQKWKNQ
jgi:hypothetical protein